MRLVVLVLGFGGWSWGLKKRVSWSLGEVVIRLCQVWEVRWAVVRRVWGGVRRRICSRISGMRNILCGGILFFFFSLLLFALFSRGFIWCGLWGFCVIRGLGGALLGLGMDGCRAVFWGYMGRTEDKDRI